MELLCVQPSMQGAAGTAVANVTKVHIVVAISSGEGGCVAVYGQRHSPQQQAEGLKKGRVADCGRATP